MSRLLGRSMRRRVGRLAFCAALAAAVTACGQPPGPQAEQPRPVKVEQVDGRDAQITESFVGTVRSRRRADLSFESGGRIAAIAVDVGDSVRAGQLLARLDPVPAQERLTKAQAEQAAAAATFVERDAQLRRTEQLEREQVVSAALREGVDAQRQAALSQRQAADAALVLARRELALGQIKAPFDGQIVARSAQPFADIGAAQPVLQIEAPGELEVVVALPASVAARVARGQAASLLWSAAGERRLAVHLDKLSGRADNGAQVQAIFRVDGAPADLRTGNTVALELPGPSKQALLLPASALLPGVKDGLAQVFVLDTVRQRVKLRQVEVDTALSQDGRRALLAGLAPGEWVVVAGAPFLSDGQAATRFISPTRLTETPR